MNEKKNSDDPLDEFPENWLAEQFDQDMLIQDNESIEGISNKDDSTAEDPFATFAFESASIASDRFAEPLAPWLSIPVPADGFLPAITWTDLIENVPKGILLYNRKIVLLKYQSNKIAVFDDVCPHAGAILRNGKVKGNRFQCVWHGWIFDLDTGDADHQEFVQLKMYPTEIRNGTVYVGVLARKDL